ncbi:asparaginase, partial [Streptomyces albidoflavus]|uniref:asparaginase n=2 Tax=Streptomyces TaxID=1883 RepID=UPI00332497A8
MTSPYSSASAPHPVLAEVVRSGFTEGHHRGSLVLLAADGSVDLALGDPAAPVFPRSSNKPMQAAAILRAGLELSGERLALAAASHSGEGFHLELVRTMLAEHGLTPDDLRTPPDLPLDPVEAEAYLAAGRVREPITMNCSGKHAAMLAVCVRNGWDTATYLDPAHPLHILVGQVVAEAAGEP